MDLGVQGDSTGVRSWSKGQSWHHAWHESTSVVARSDTERGQAAAGQTSSRWGFQNNGTQITSSKLIFIGGYLDYQHFDHK